MKKILLTLILAMSAAHSYAQGTLGNYEYGVRCQNFEPAYPGGLDNTQAPKRVDWGLNCSRTDRDVTFIIERLEWVDPTNGSIFPMYPVFGVPEFTTVRGKRVRKGGSNPKNLSMPVDKNASCAVLPADYSVIAMCRASCYTKTVKVLTPNGFYTAKEFHNMKDLGQVTSIASESVIGNVIPESRKVLVKVASLVEGTHDIYEIETDSGKIVEVTAGHPLVTASGHFIKGSDVAKGTGLLNEHGESEIVVSVVKKQYEGKVYNVVLDGRKGKRTDKIFVLEGLLSGDADIQNDDIAKLSRAVNKYLSTPEEI